MSGRHRTVSTTRDALQESRRRNGRAYRYLAGGIVAILVFAAGGWFISDRVLCMSGTPSLTVAAAPDIAPAITDAASRFHEGEGRCVDITVSTREPADMATRLSGPSTSAGERAQVWLPDSSLWIGIASNSRRGKKLLSDSPSSVARSPVVLAVGRQAARQAGWPESELGWKSLLPDSGDGAGSTFAPLLTDPMRDTSGLAALLAFRKLAADAESPDAKLAGIVRSLGENIAPTASAQFTSLSQAGTESPTAAVVSEQAVWQYNRDHQQGRMVAIYPPAGTISLDYPYTLVGASAMDEKVRAAAKSFGEFLRNEDGRAALREFGFRTPDGDAPAMLGKARGFAPQPPKQLPEPKPSEVLRVRQGWRTLTLDSRTLVLIDISGSMAQLVPGTSHTRMQATLKAATKGLALFPPGTHMGLWTFSTRLDGDKDYKKVVEIGPLRTNREEHAAAHSSITPKPHGHTGLYDSILAAYETVRESYDPRRVNSVIVLTDGNNDDPEGIALEGLLSELRSMHDPSRPIPVISIALGPDVDLGPLEKIAKVTQGGAYAAERPSDIGQVFRKAIGARTCRPNCDKD